MKIFTILFSLLLFTLPSVVEADSLDDLREWQLVNELQANPNLLIDSEVRENHRFYGPAAYYQAVAYFIVGKGHIERVPEDEQLTLSKGQWLAATGRFKVLVINEPGLTFHVSEEKLFIENPQIFSEGTNVYLAEKLGLSTVAPELDQLRYAHLWTPFALLSKFIEYVLSIIHSYIAPNWVITLIIFTVLLRLILVPVSITSARVQRRVDQIKMSLTPKLDDIKAKFKGAEAHEKIMNAHKELGVSPFYTLKPMLWTLVQIPFLIAVFNALGEMPQFTSSSFLWIENMAYPDALFTIPVAFPLFGNEINLLPFLMAGVTVISVLLLQNTLLPSEAFKKQKRNLYFMAFGFFLLFYAFPAVMVFFWMLTNIVQAIQQRVFKV